MEEIKLIMRQRKINRNSFRRDEVKEKRSCGSLDSIDHWLILSESQLILLVEKSLLLSQEWFFFILWHINVAYLPAFIPKYMSKDSYAFVSHLQLLFEITLREEETKEREDWEDKR